MDEDEAENWFLCHSPFGTEKTNQLTARGLPALRAACMAKNPEAYRFLGALQKNAEVRVHEKCRKDICRRSVPSSPAAASTDAQQQSSSRVLTRSLHSNFDFAAGCLFCSAPIPDSAFTSSKYSVSSITKESTKQHLLDHCGNRDDGWGDTVRTRIVNVPDLSKAGARYHRACYSDFLRSDRKCKPQASPASVASTPSPPLPCAKRPRRTSVGSSPLLFSPPLVPDTKPAGRHADSARNEGFNKLCEYLESTDECQFTLKELTAKMAEYTNGVAYGERYTLQLLCARFGQKLLVNERPGRCTLLCFGEKASDILANNWHHQKRASEVGERQRIVETAAAIIRDDIRRQAHNLDEYPTVGEVEEGGWESLPRSLRTLLTEVICKGKKGAHASHLLKCNMIGQSIVSATRPRSFVSPLQHALAVYLHRSFGSRHLVDLLHCLGTCSSYSDAVNYERAIVMHAKPTITDIVNIFVQFVFDNADFDVSTIDGLGTFHVMGGIKSVTPATSLCLEFKVPRSSGYQSVDVSQHGSIPLSAYRGAGGGFQKITVEDFRPGTPWDAVTAAAVSRAAGANRINFLWLAGTAFQSTPTPGWTGFLQMAHSSKPPQNKAAIAPVPFINLEATNPTTINTALEFAVAQTNAVGQLTTVVTFDLPLFMKALEMVLAAPAGSPISSIIVALGGFHLLMSFIHALAYFMAGSGLEQMLSTIYAPKSITHIMSAKAFTRAVRAHFLSQTCIFELLCQRAGILTSALKSDLCTLFNEVARSKTTFEMAANNSRLGEMVEVLNSYVSELSSGRLAKLWLNYFKHVNIMRAFIIAQKSGDWELHLLCIRDMLPVFHAAGHLNYAKAAQIYLQQMSGLENKMTPAEFDRYTRQGGFVIRRFDRYFCGVWPDLVIEQSLMRPLKVQGGLTHGRGITESTKATFIHSMPLTTLLTRALETYTGKATLTSEQHVDLREARQIRDLNDRSKVRAWLQQHDPFQECQDLRSLTSGLKATPAVNCDMSLEAGLQAMERSQGKKYTELTLHRKDRVANFASIRPGLQIGDDVVQVNCNTAFHRIRCVISSEDLASCFKYELAPVPPSLFDDTCTMRKGTKSTLSQALPTVSALPHNPLFVLDGGFLLHKVAWPRPATYAQVVQTYVQFVLRLYSAECTVVFDGYGTGPSIKDVEHQRRSNKNMSVDINVEPNLNVVTTQAQFLTNGKNKEGLIRLISAELRKNGVGVLQAAGDADRLVATTAIELAQLTGRNVVVVGNDADVLALLVTLTAEQPVYMLMPGKQSYLQNKVYDIGSIRSTLGDAADLMLFLHAITGCDSTSALFKKGKKEPLKKLLGNEELRNLVTVFNKENSTPEEIAAAGEAFLLAVYGVYASETTLDAARYTLYMRTVAKKPITEDFDIATLPPTSAAARQHSFRAYFQVQEWRGAQLNPTDWGWKLTGGMFQPVTTTLPPAPPEILKLSACGCAGDCSTRRCVCFAAGRKCTVMCGKCSGVTCANAMPEVGAR